MRLFLKNFTFKNLANVKRRSGNAAIIVAVYNINVHINLMYDAL
jgi:hypothetical protein